MKTFFFDILRSSHFLDSLYFAEKVFWMTDIDVGFVSSFVTQFRNPHDYTIDFKDELPLYIDQSRRSVSRGVA